jgi:two-component system phosphate regulon sensor histidine kinase PhoR
MWRSPLFWRLFGAYGVLLLCAIGSLGYILSYRFERHYKRQSAENLSTEAVLVREAVQGWPGEGPVRLQERTHDLGQHIKARITLLAADGTVLADSDQDPQSMENHAGRPEVEEARKTGRGAATRFSSTLQESMMYLALWTADPHSRVACVRVALPLGDVAQHLAELERLVWTAAILTAVAAMALAFWLARRMTQPLQELARGADLIAAGKYGQKVYLDSRDELGTLAYTFNHMSERLVEQFTQLEEDRQQLRTILGGMVEGVVALDAGQRILFANERAAQLLDFQTQTAVGRRLWEIVRQRSVQDLVRQALASSEPCSGQLSWDSSGKSLTMHAARLPGTPPRGAVLVLHDTTELRRLERVRQEFVANVSHELKTPLSVIKVCVETLLDGAMEDPVHRGRFLDQIAEQAERLHALILDLLSLARIESGTEILTFTEIPVATVVTGCLERHEARAQAKQQRLEAVPDGEAAVWADEEALNEVLDNLVDNAVKYTPDGGQIRVKWRTESGQVCLDVEDTGIGIPAQDLPRIFERFYRVDKARSRELGGTGLGLSIVKHLVQAMHGTVQATSQVGRGTTFHIRLPQVRPTGSS